MQNMMDQVDAGNIEVALQNMKDGTAHNAREAGQAALDAIRVGLEEDSNRISGESAQTYQTATITIVVASILGVLVGVVLGIFISRSITKPLSEVVRVAQGVSEGHLDLSTKVKIDSKDEVGMLAAVFNR
jgi:methyl-accepting chemotaxis protein